MMTQLLDPTEQLQKHFSPQDHVLFQLDKESQAITNSISSDESLDILLPRQQTVCPKRLRLLDKEKSIVNYLKKLGIKTKTDPLEKSLTYFRNKKIKLVKNPLDNFLQKDFILPKLKLMISQDNDSSVLGSYEKQPLANRNKAGLNKQFNVSQIKLMSCQNDSSFEISNDMTPVTFKNQQELGSSDFNLSKNRFCKGRQGGFQNKTLNKFSGYLEDLSNEHYDKASTCASMKEVQENTIFQPNKMIFDPNDNGRKISLN